MTYRPRSSTWITLGAIALFLVFLLVFNLMLDAKTPEDYPEGIAYAKAVVLEVTTDTVQPDPYYPGIQIGRQDVVLQITSGPHKGEIVATYNLVERIVNNPAGVGTKYVISSFDDFFTVSIVSYDRSATTWLLGLLFVAAVLFWGGRKGAASLLSLAFTLICILFFFMPLLVRGAAPIPAAVGVVLISTVVTLWSLNGWCAKTAAAITSCTVCTLLAGLLAWVTGALSSIDTMRTPEAEDLLFVMQGTNLSIRHLLFAGILFASLGAVMDTSMSITSSIFELREVDSSLRKRDLVRSGMNVGKDIMGTMTNTLILAFTGSSINTIVIYYLYAMPAVRLINMEFFMIEVLRGLSASIGVVLAVPVSVVVAATVATREGWALAGAIPAKKPVNQKKNGQLPSAVR